MEIYLVIVTREQLRNADIHRTSACTVMTGCAWNEVYLAECLAHIIYSLHFLFVKRFEILHIAHVIIYLRKITHSREHHEHIRETCCKTDSIARIAHTTVETVKDTLCLFGKIYEVSALYRLHYDYSLAVFFTDLIYSLAVNSMIAVIKIVELDLHRFYLRIIF